MFIDIFMVLYIKYGKQSNLTIEFIFYLILSLTGFAIAVLLNKYFRLGYGYKLVGMMPY